MTPEELEYEYNPRVHVADVERYIRQASLDSEQARKTLKGHYDVPYGDQPLMNCDIFPAGRNAPIHVFIHGGYWKGRDKADYSFMVRPMLEQGITVVVANYGLCPDVDLATIVRQTACLFAWVHAHGGDYGGDVHRITTSAHSAGAHLVAMALSPEAEQPIKPGVIKAAVLVSGLYDIDPVRSISVNEDIRLTESWARALSPMFHLPYPEVTLRIVAGSGETASWVAQSERYYQQVKDHSAEVSLDLLEGHDHFSIIAELIRPDSALTRLCIESALST